LLIDTDRSRLSIAALWAWVWPAVRLQQIQFLFSEEGRPLGFATWAFVIPETAQRLRAGAVPIIEDWNDGDLLWIMDFVAPYGHARSLAHILRRRLRGRYSDYLHARDHGSRTRLDRGAPGGSNANERRL
jgi:hemolysin-activating ACP:hemolysin acyltransferase